MPAARPMLERFWSKVNKDGPIPTGHPEYEGLGPCWLFNEGEKSPSLAYDKSHLAEGPKRISAWRYSWEIHVGPIPDGQIVRHKCDNGHLFCVNPGHLELGTQADNVRDMYLRRSLPRRRITTEMAQAMVRLYEEHGAPAELLAQAANVAPGEVKRALYGGRVGAAPVSKLRRAPPLTDEEFAVVQSVIDAGGSLNAAACRIGRNWITVRGAFKARGLDYQRRPRFTPEEEATVRRVLAEGRSINAAAHEIGRSWPHVRRFIRDLGLDVNPDAPRETWIGVERRTANARKALATRWARKRGEAA